MICINLISSPRNISTALMYSFAQRPDCIVFDEPLYAHYLIASGAEHPGRSKMTETRQKDARRKDAETFGLIGMACRFFS